MIMNEMRVGGCDLSPKQEQAIIFLARGYSIVETAKRLKISEQTIYNWKANPDFLDDLRDETRAYLAESRAGIGALALPAINKLAKLLESEDENIQLKAIRVIMKSNGLDSLNMELHMLQGLGMETAYSEECEEEEKKKKTLRSLLGPM